MANSTKLQKRNGKLESSLNQWKGILSKEMNISEDLRKHNVVAQAEKMIGSIEAMMIEPLNNYCRV